MGKKMRLLLIILFSSWSLNAVAENCYRDGQIIIQTQNGVTRLKECNSELVNFQPRQTFSSRDEANIGIDDTYASVLGRPTAVNFPSGKISGVTLDRWVRNIVRSGNENSFIKARAELMAEHLETLGYFKQTTNNIFNDLKAAHETHIEGKDVTAIAVDIFAETEEEAYDSTLIAMKALQEFGNDLVNQSTYIGTRTWSATHPQCQSCMDECLRPGYQIAPPACLNRCSAICPPAAIENYRPSNRVIAQPTYNNTQCVRLSSWCKNCASNRNCDSTRQYHGACNMTCNRCNPRDLRLARQCAQTGPGNLPRALPGNR